jgi:hypothetical protein
VKHSFLVILVASALLLSAASGDSLTSQKNSIEKHKRETAIEAEATKQREHEADVFLSAIQAEQADIVKLVQAIEDQAAVRQKQDHANSEPWRWLWWLTSFRVQQGLLVVGALYTFFAAWQLLQIRRQGNIASTTLALANRPKIKMRCFYVKRDIDQDASAVHSWEIEIGYELVNYGGTEAIIMDSRHRVWMNPIVGFLNLPMPAPYGDQPILASTVVLDPGESRQFSITGEASTEDRASLQPHIDMERRYVPPHFRPYCIGYIVYKGRVGNSYRTAFCRLLNRQHGQPHSFETSKDPNYEYED